MRQLVESLYAGSEHYELYLGVVEMVEGVIKGFPADTEARRACAEIAAINNEMILNYIVQHGLGVPRSY
jgi:hypothetical protein